MTFTSPLRRALLLMATMRSVLRRSSVAQTFTFRRGPRLRPVSRILARCAVAREKSSIP